MQAPKRTVAAFVGLVALLLAMAPAFACAPLAQVTTSAKEGQGGSMVALAGTGFLSQTEGSPIDIRWDSDASRPAATVLGPAFSTTVAVPTDVGVHILIASQRVRATGAAYARVATTFDVTKAAIPPSAAGYWLVASDGGIFAFGDAGFFGSTGRIPLQRPVVGMAPTPSGKGYWLAASDGGIFAFGDAGFFGSTGGIPLQRPIVGMAPTPSGKGYWLAASDGGIFAFGDARFLGSMGGVPLNQPIVGMSAMPGGTGYWLVAADSGVFAFGDAVYHGPAGRAALTKPVIGMTPTASGQGYWMAAANGGIYAGGDAGSFGAADAFPLAKPIVGVTPSGSGNGYWLAASDGGIFAFGDAGFFGSTGGLPLNRPIVGLAATRPGSAALLCRNSTDPACGAFRWDPAPAPNQPLLASFTGAPANAVVGQQVMFDVAWSDGDAALSDNDLRVSALSSIVIVECFPFPPRYGPWTTPAAVPSSGALHYPFTFASPGTYNVYVRLATAADCRSPYANSKELQTTIAVAAAPHG